MAPASASPKLQRHDDIEQAAALYRQGQYGEAERICGALLAAMPDRLDVRHLLGVLRHQQGRNVEALSLIGAVLRAAPKSADVLNDYGLVLGALDRDEEALAHFDRALTVHRDHVSASCNRAATLRRLKRYADALAAYDRVVALQPGHLGALNECGGLLVRLGRPEQALGRYDRALAIAPALAELHVNKGTALCALNRFDAASASFAAAMAAAPDRAEAHWNASLIQLRQGDFAAGWKGYEWRWRKSDWAHRRRRFSAPLWLGEEPIEGRTILLHAEQGFGDTIQFVRYVALVARRGANVILEVPAEMASLVQGIEGAAHIVRRGDALPSFDLHCPLLSLPLALGTRLETIPNRVPYLNAPDQRLRHWADQLAGIARPRVGLVWAGSPAHPSDHNRSIPLRDIVPIVSLEGVQVVSLQKHATAKDVAALARHPNVTHIGDALGDFADAAAAIAMLDLVISVDTAPAHLAGAMGKPVWLLVPFSPDFRWMLDREDSPWYPTARLFRQQRRGDWQGVVERVRQELIKTMKPVR